MDITNEHSAPDMPTPDSSEELRARTDIQTIGNAVAQLQVAMGKIIVGKTDIIDLILVAILADGHILLEGMPGVAKTLMAKTAAGLLDVAYNRIQFTPDLMPSDVLGTNVFNPATASFAFNKGPVFSNIVLIDEINRAPAKTQAALFEVMEERQVSMDSAVYRLDTPFLIIGTQNPVEHEGTYRLPEAQLDRFLFKISIGYPTAEEELDILRLHHNGKGTMARLFKAILTKETLLELRSLVHTIHISDEILEYISRIVVATRNHKDIFLGASPRASIALMKTAKAYAILQGRDFVIPEDIMYLALPVLRHRIILMPEKEMEGFMNDDIIAELLKSVPVPR